MGTKRRALYTVVNLSSTPIWAAMILAPRSRLTRRMVELITPLQLGLGGVYDGLFTAGLIRHGKMLDFTNPDRVREGLANPDLFIAAWAHYIAFDVFVGRWIWQDALEAGTGRHWRTRLSLLLTMMAGPAGMSLYLVTRRKST